MRACDFLCLFFGRRADHLHHITGKDTEDNYLDPDFKAPVTKRAHSMEHAGWAGEPDFSDGGDRDHNWLRLRRTSHFLIRLGQHHGTFVVLPAFFVVQLGLMLARIADDLDERE
jgi:hypothetical protein